MNICLLYNNKTMTQGPSIRLYVASPLLTGSLIALDDARAHYVRHVMRRSDGDVVAAFNAEHGEWEATLRMHGKRDVQLAIGRKLADPREVPDVWFAFATIKNKNELVVEKATELGAREIHAIITKHSVVKSVNLEKLAIHAIEAAEQCERHDVPEISEHKNLAAFLGGLPADRTLFYGDESGQGKPLPEVFSEVGAKKCAVLIGPEGGFSADEHHMLRTFAKGFGMGPRILKADTAAVAALACLQSAAGDWNQRPHFKGNE